ncbi:MAG: (Fe-S)-binding protein [Caldilineaceae bacterium]
MPQTNCKECGFPTCLAFAMKLAAKQAELASCPYVSDAAKGQLESASAPPIRLVTVSSNGYKVAAGNETVLFRHEKTFYHPPGLFVRVRDTQPLDEVRAVAQAVADYKVDYVGLDLAFDGMAVQAESGAADAFKACVAAVREVNHGNLILMADDAALLEAGLAAAAGVTPLLYAATDANWQEMAAVAKRNKVPLAGCTCTDALAALTKQIAAAG